MTENRSHQLKVERTDGMANNVRAATFTEETLRISLYIYAPSRRVVTSTWWEGLVLPMIPRAMPVGA
jgi:hypothetical protein